MFTKALCIFASAMLMAISASAQTDTKTPKEEQCTVSGMVVTIGGSAPLRKARLLLQSVDDRTRRIAAGTGADGRFTIKGIVPGSYRLSVSRVGFVTQEYGQRKPESPGAILTLRPRQEMKDLVFRMIPSGVIAGRILDEDGERLPGVSVQVEQQSYSEGKRKLSPVGRAETNDLGEYRLYGLSPGRYFITAIYPRWSRPGERGEEGDEAPSAEAAGSQSHEEGYAKMYYPGTAEVAKAQSITIKPGEEVSSIEILMRQVLVHHIRGHVYNQITHKPGLGAGVILIPKADNQQWENTQQSIVQKADGSFEIREVLQGSYVLAGYWFDEGKMHITRQPLEVGDGDVEGITLTIAPGIAIAGRIVWDGRPSVENGELSVAPEAVDSQLGYYGPSRVDANNTFSLKDISEGPYRAHVTGLSKDCYVKELRYGTASGLKDGFVVTRGEPKNLEIVVSSRGARVQGTVLDADGLPLAGVSVALVPELSRRDDFRLYKTANTDQYGHFELRGIVPGEYELFSWEEVEADAWQDPEFLKPFEKKSERVTLNDDDHITVKITAIRVKGDGDGAQ